VDEALKPLSSLKKLSCVTFRACIDLVGRGITALQSCSGMRRL